MTSFAFILGVVPLLVARGAGAEMRRTLGTAVFSGMLGVTLFGIFLTPVFFTVIDWLGESQVVPFPLCVQWIVLFHPWVLCLGVLCGCCSRLLGDLVRAADGGQSGTSAETDDSDQPH